MLTLEVSKIPPDGQDLDAGLDPSEVHVEGERQFALLPGGTFVGRVDRGDENSVHVRGRVRAELGLECGRCLESYRLPVAQELDLFYLPHRPGADEAEDDVELTDRDMVVAYYDGVRLDLGEVLREQLFLALPMTRACRPECLGFCPSCGANRNLAACACAAAPAEADPRLMALGKLLDQEPEGRRH